MSECACSLLRMKVDMAIKGVNGKCLIGKGSKWELGRDIGDRMLEVGSRRWQLPLSGWCINPQ